MKKQLPAELKNLYRTVRSSSGGFVALFSGESGTGKTMAGVDLASTLKAPFFKVDVSTIVSKYIGETEKNLSRILKAAEDTGAVLFFDEADALFGKRSEVKDSHDRYANMEISYLLKRLESYRGLVVLATNLKSNLDGTFLRAIRHALQFPLQESDCDESEPISSHVDIRRGQVITRQRRPKK